MKHWNVIIAGLALLGPSAHALELEGAISGGGGQGVVCSKNGKTSVELLDLWEARTLYDRIPTAVGDLKKAVDDGIERLKSSFSFTGFCGSDGSLQGPQCVEYLTHQEANLFFTNSERVRRLRGVVLTRTEDAYEVARPEGCEIRQIANYQVGGRILLDQDLFEKLSVSDQAALILHESYYSVLRTLFKEPNSIRVRRAIGFVMSGGSFQENPNLQTPAAAFCESKDKKNMTMFSVYPPSTTHPNGQIRILSLGGLVPIGFDQIDLSLPLQLNVSHSGQAPAWCGSHDVSVTVGSMTGVGPVEFDHTLELLQRCDYGNATLQATVTGADGISTTTDLECIAVIH